MASTGDSLPAESPANPDKLVASCHCGRVKLELPSPPTKLNQCHCSKLSTPSSMLQTLPGLTKSQGICYRYGALWAYYPQDDVLVTAEEPGTRSYVRQDGSCKGIIGFYFCNHCGCMTHWGIQPEHVKEDDPEWNTIGVNTRMLPESAL